MLRLDDRWKLLATGALATLLCVTVQPVEARPVVFVSVGEPSRDTVRLLAPYLAEMSRHEFVDADPRQVRSKLGSRVPKSGRSDPGLQTSDLVGRFEDGLAHFRKGQWKDAVTKLEAAIVVARDNAALLVDETTHRETWMRGLIALAMSKYRLQDIAGGDKVNEDLVRAYPNQEITVQALSGTEAARYYAAAQSRLETRGRGKLTVEVKDQSARVYLDEGDRPQNGALDADLLPGTHRVLVRPPGTDGLLYEVTVEPGRPTFLDADLAFGTTLAVNERYVGFVFRSQDERRRLEVDYAAQLAALLGESPDLVIIEKIVWEGRPAFASIEYLADSGMWAQGTVAILDGKDDDTKMRELARATFGRPSSHPAVKEIPDPARETMRRWEHRWRKWAVAGGAATALGIGAALLLWPTDCGNESSCGSGKTVAGYATLGGGIALGALATYMFATDRPSPRSPATVIGLRPVSSGATLTFSFSY